jgi:hypothetical protein
VWSDPLHCFRPVIYNENRNSNVSRRQRAVRRTVFVDARIDASQQSVADDIPARMSGGRRASYAAARLGAMPPPEFGAAIGTGVSCFEQVRQVANFASFFCDFPPPGRNY